MRIRKTLLTHFLYLLPAALRAEGFLSKQQQPSHAAVQRQGQQQQREHGNNGLTRCPASCVRAASKTNGEGTPYYKHALAILSMPHTSMDRIANEAILDQVLPTTNKLSIVLRCEGSPAPSLASLRRYVSEVYSQLWDYAMEEQDPDLLPDAVVYPQSLPNAAPESWIHIQPDLDCLCSHDSIIGWTSEAATGRGKRFQTHDGIGGLDAHVAALNNERRSRNLPPVAALHVHPWPKGADPVTTQSNHIVFLDDDDDVDKKRSSAGGSSTSEGSSAAGRVNGAGDGDASLAATNPLEDDELLLGGAKIQSQNLYESVSVGGTFDGLHFGHRKLLTLAMSTVNPLTGRLLVGVTVDAMLQKKPYAAYIPSLQDRMRAVREFLHRLAPGSMNRVKIVPIEDRFGPPGRAGDHYDALMLSHETLATGIELNQHRTKVLGLKPLKLLCTRRTEAHGMSSTTLRRLRSQKDKRTV